MVRYLFFLIYLNRIRKEFLDAEAELSGSEGSDDEDERGLDKLLVEEGDLDDIDIDEVRYSNCLSIDLDGKKNLAASNIPFQGFIGT